MRSVSLKAAVLVAALFLLQACGKSSDTKPLCTESPDMTLYTSGTSTTIMTGITVTAAQNAGVPPVPVWVGYHNPPVNVILAGYPADGVDPLNFGIDIVQVGADTDNPLQFNATFNAIRAKGTYQAVLRFVAANLAVSQPLGCTDLPVTFIVQ